MCLKIIAMGFALRPYSYLRDAWNIVSYFDNWYSFIIHYSWILLLLSWDGYPRL